MAKAPGSINNEGEFQKWVEARFIHGHVQSHEYSSQPDVPDVSASMLGMDYWLELKYARFRCDRQYSPFKFDEVKRGQLDWLDKRAQHGRAECGILGYCQIESRTWISYSTSAWYLRRIWFGESPFSIAAAMLTPMLAPADRVKTGNDLVMLIDQGAQWCRFNLARL